MKRCSDCGEEKSYTEFYRAGTTLDGYRGVCKGCELAELRAFSRNNREHLNRQRRERYANDTDHRDSYRAYNRARFRQYKYGITYEEFHAMIDAQDNVCSICKKSNGRQVLYVDHDHKTGRIRGLLCHTCNTFLGRIDDSIETLEYMIEYLD